jgi:hypothetical protein
VPVSWAPTESFMLIASLSTGARVHRGVAR